MYKIIPKTIRLALTEEEKDALKKVAALFEEVEKVIIEDNGQCKLVGYNGGAIEYKRFKYFKSDIDKFADTDEIQLL